MWTQELFVFIDHTEVLAGKDPPEYSIEINSSRVPGRIVGFVIEPTEIIFK